MPWRIQEACRLFAETSRTVRKIATAAGFDDELHFSRRFRLENGLPPGKHRRLRAQ